MTMIQIDQPEAAAAAAREAGLLTPAALEPLILEAIRRQAGRRRLDVTNKFTKPASSQCRWMKSPKKYFPSAPSTAPTKLRANNASKASTAFL